jgi:uncharacterized protein YrrD
MKYPAKELKKFRLRAKDGEIGKVEDFYFEDTNWMLRYLVADAESLKADRQVLLSPYVLREPDRTAKVISVNLTLHQVESSPESGAEKPISRQHEHALHAYYGWPIYWGYPGIFPGFIPVPPRDLEIPEEELLYNPHLRSFEEIAGSRVQAVGGAAGHVEDMILDTETWEFRFLVVDTGGWLSGRKVLLTVDRVENIEYLVREIWVDVTCDLIRETPEYDPQLLLDREYEDRVYEHYHPRAVRSR